MDLRAVLDTWIEPALKKLGLSAAEASRQSGHPYLIQNLRRTLKNGHGSVPKDRTLLDLAKVIGDAPAGLLGPTMVGTSDLDLLEARREALARELERLDIAIAEIRVARKTG